MEPSALQVLFAGRLRRHLSARDTRYSRHWAIHFVIDGRATVTYDEDSAELDGDWVWTGYPGPRVRVAPYGALPRLHYRAALRGGLLDRWLDEGLWPQRPLPVADGPALQRRADRLLEMLTGDEAIDNRLRANAVEAFLLELQRQQRDAEPAPSWVLDCLRLLERHWNQPVDYAALAGRYHMPVHSLRRGFKRALGVPIHSWLLQLRHREAQRLLLETDDDLATVAERCGYADVAFFSRQFKRFAGMPPGQFRRATYG